MLKLEGCELGVNGRGSSQRTIRDEMDMFVWWNHIDWLSENPETLPTILATALGFRVGWGAVGPSKNEAPTLLKDAITTRNPTQI